MDIKKIIAKLPVGFVEDAAAMDGDALRAAMPALLDALDAADRAVERAGGACGRLRRERDDARAEVETLRAEAALMREQLAAVTTERDALLAVCERFAGDEGVICNGYEDDSGCGSCGANANHSDADPANHAPDCARLAARVLAAKIRALPLDAPGGGS